MDNRTYLLKSEQGKLLMGFEFYGEAVRYAMGLRETSFVYVNGGGNVPDRFVSRISVSGVMYV